MPRAAPRGCPLITGGRTAFGFVCSSRKCATPSTPRKRAAKTAGGAPRGPSPCPGPRLARLGHPGALQCRGLLRLALVVSQFINTESHNTLVCACSASTAQKCLHVGACTPHLSGGCEWRQLFGLVAVRARSVAASSVAAAGRPARGVAAAGCRERASHGGLVPTAEGGAAPGCPWASWAAAVGRCSGAD